MSIDLLADAVGPLGIAGDGREQGRTLAVHARDRGLFLRDHLTLVIELFEGRGPLLARAGQAALTLGDAFDKTRREFASAFDAGFGFLAALFDAGEAVAIGGGLALGLGHGPLQHGAALGGLLL